MIVLTTWLIWLRFKRSHWNVHQPPDKSLVFERFFDPTSGTSDTISVRDLLLRTLPAVALVFCESGFVVFFALVRLLGGIIFAAHFSSLSGDSWSPGASSNGALSADSVSEHCSVGKTPGNDPLEKPVLNLARCSRSPSVSPQFICLTDDMTSEVKSGPGETAMICLSAFVERWSLIPTLPVTSRLFSDVYVNWSEFFTSSVLSVDRSPNNWGRSRLPEKKRTRSDNWTVTLNSVDVSSTLGRHSLVLNQHDTKRSKKKNRLEMRKIY